MNAPATSQPGERSEQQHEVRRRPNQERKHSWSTVAAMVLSVMIPVCGWMISLSNRISALEVKSESLATAVQVAELKQRINDWIEASEREHVDNLAREARTSK